MDAEWLDLLAALVVVALAGWWLVRSLRGPPGCAECPPSTEVAQGGEGGVRVPTTGLKIGRRR